MTPSVKADLKLFEGYAKRLPDGRCEAYPDPLTNGAPWTIGRGHCGPEVHPGLIWTLEQADAAFERDFAKAVADLDAKLPWWRTLNDARQDVLLEMTFNLGIGFPPIGKQDGHGLRSFVNTLAAMKRGDYAAAAAGMRKSAWYRQVGSDPGERGHRLAHQMETGVR